MSNAEAETNFDPFEDNEAPETQNDEGAEQSSDEQANESEPSGEQEEAGQSEEENPTGESENEEEQSQNKTEKMIPESRMKAALNDVSTKLTKTEEELNQTKAELMKFKTVPVPDKDADPEGYAVHQRIEFTKKIMRDVYPDYNEKIAHYQTMAEVNPLLNEAVKAAENPAKYAYDLAKCDMELREISKVVESDDWKKFQEWQKNGGKSQQTQTAPNNDVAKQLGAGGAQKVPNLNRATNANNPKGNSNSDDDELFKGAL